jgi:hypothetical protein
MKESHKAENHPAIAITIGMVFQNDSKLRKNLLATQMGCGLASYLGQYG